MIENKGKEHIGAIFRSGLNGTFKKFAAELLARPRIAFSSAVLPICHRFCARSL
jgi:hypothetical protein